MTLDELENAVAGLSSEELARFRQWFVEFDLAVWDRQLERDAQAGKLDRFATEAIRDHKSGKTSEL